MRDRDQPDDRTEPTAPETVRPSRPRAILLHLSLIAFAVALLVRAGQVQLVAGAYWAERADAQHMRVDSLPAPRGIITDARGDKLVSSQELLQLTIAPNQVRPARAGFSERDTLAAELLKLGVSRSVVRRAMDSTSKYVGVPGQFIPSEAARIRQIRGVSAEWTMRRQVSASAGMRPLLGTIDFSGEARGGVEEALDSLLTGQRGSRRALRDARGRAWDSPVGATVNARPGHSVRLTVNQQLQEIVERELLDAVRATQAEGGDLVVLDPADGAILALAGVRNGKLAAVVTPLTEAYEPGSVLKPLFIARLLDQQRIRAYDSVNTENGFWVADGRKLTDEHKAPAMSVFDVVRWSSNIGIAKLVTQHMSQGEEYELLRDYGFGTFTALPLQGESRGVLYKPADWTRPSAVSLAIGYELMVTPMQLATAYAALANGGELLEPALVREVRSPEGEVVFTHQRRVVRRVGSTRSMAAVRSMLQAVVDSGTGQEAALGARFQVGGKSGTARRQELENDGTRTYNATFAGMFPVDAPELVLVARLIRPTSAIFGGVVAGPIVREVLRGAMAASHATMNRESLARMDLEAELPMSATMVNASSQRVAEGVEADSSKRANAAPSLIEPAPGRVVVTLPVTGSPTVQAPLPVRPVPSVTGLTVRDAVRTLHSAGFRVRMTSGGVAGRTRPAVGSLQPPGSLVVLERGRR